MALPEKPEYMTGAWAHAYIEACGEETQARFEQEQIRTGIEIPNTDVVLRTAQLELVSRVI